MIIGISGEPFYQRCLLTTEVAEYDTSDAFARDRLGEAL